MSWMWAILNSLMYAGCAAALAPSAKAFRFHNLAAGSWVVLGGWLAARLATSQPFGRQAGLLTFGTLLVLGTSQVILASLAARRPAEGSRVFLLSSLGVALVVNAIGPSRMLESSGVTISFDSAPIGIAAGVLAAVLTVFAAYYVVRSRWFAVAVIRYRSSRIDLQTSVEAGVLVAIELVLLLFLGAGCLAAHKGIFASSEQLTLIPVLAVAAGAEKPLRSAVFAFGTTIAAHWADATFAAVTGHCDTLSLCVLATVCVVRAAPWNWVLAAKKISSVPPLWRMGASKFNEYTLSCGLVVLLPAVGAALLFSTSVPLQRSMWLLCLVVAAWISRRYLGVISVAWALPGVLVCYFVIFARHAWHTPAYWTFFVVALLVASLWAVYLFVLRSLDDDTAMLFDVAIVVSAHHFVRSSTAISGAENVRQLTERDIGGAVGGRSLAIQAVIAVSLLTAAFLGLSSRTWRSRVLALCNFPMGMHHGFPVRGLFYGAAAVLGLAAVLSTRCYHAVQPTVTPEELGVGFGMMVALIADVAARSSVVWAGVIVVVYCAIQVALFDGGTDLDAGVGFCFVLVGVGMIYRHAIEAHVRWVVDRALVWWHG